MNAEYVHIGLMVGQYVIIPFTIWAARSYKQSIIDTLKAHVDATIKTHEEGEDGKFTELSARIGRIEELLIRRGLPKAVGRTGRAGAKRTGGTNV